MEFDDIKKILNLRDNITVVEDISSQRTYAGKSYQVICRFILAIESKGIPIIVGIPLVWSLNLVDFYVDNYKELMYIPHLDIDGKLCLFDLEGVLIEKNFNGLLNQSIDRLYKTISDGLNGLNSVDFIEEFEEYWRRLPNTKTLKSMVAPDNGVKRIKYSSNKKSKNKINHENYMDFVNKQDKYTFFASDSEKDFKMYEDMKIIRNGIYIYIDLQENIYPPDWRRDLDLEFINGLIGKVKKSDIISHIYKCTSDLLLIFMLKQPINVFNIFGVMVENFNFDRVSEKPQIQSYQKLIPCNILREDTDYLLNRGGALANLSDKKVLVIGCGSIGGYFINELVKTGLRNIMIVDDDKLKEENIYRHFLGMEYVGTHKSKALVDYINKNIPNINIISLEETIEEAILEENISFEDYDLIVSAVGNHNVNRWINEQLLLNHTEISVIYMWNEVLGIGNHVAIISTKYDGCYECFFDKSDDDYIYDRTSYCEKGQSFAKKLTGCGSSFLPFSAINSITTSVIGLEIMQDYFEGKINTNILISNKGDDYYFTKAGYVTSNRYRIQDVQKYKIEGKKFKMNKCNICGGK